MASRNVTSLQGSVGGPMQLSLLNPAFACWLHGGFPAEWEELRPTGTLSNPVLAAGVIAAYMETDKAA